MRYENSLYYKLLHRTLYVDQKHMIKLNAKTTYHQCVIDATNKTKQLFMRSITAEIKKKIWNTFEPIIKTLNKN